LGDRSLSGLLPEHWQDAPHPENTILRVIKVAVPLPWEIIVYEVPDDTANPAKDWVAVGKMTLPGPEVRVGQTMTKTSRDFLIFRGTLESGRQLEAKVDQRFPLAEAERFLANLRANR
jgi:hypothetical protein